MLLFVSYPTDLRQRLSLTLEQQQEHQILQNNCGTSETKEVGRKFWVNKDLTSKGEQAVTPWPFLPVQTRVL